tara:strand:+ start:143 stop:283 length:141 start_codon:yes stop_codon:yes gene_type:complete
MDREDLEERRRIAALLANQARHLEIDPEGILVVDEEGSDTDPQPKQ